MFFQQQVKEVIDDIEGSGKDPLSAQPSGGGPTPPQGLKQYYIAKIEELQLTVADKTQNLCRLQAQRNELNAKGKLTMLRIRNV